MSSRVSQLQVLRQERHPLVAFAALAFVMRLCITVLATALSPNAAAAAGFTSLCQPSGQHENLAGQHDALSCQCGPVCAHGCALGPCLAGNACLPQPIQASGTPGWVQAYQDSWKSDVGRFNSIRAPPVSLI
ncbi:hypothetical protein [uncultured Roseibium sp.]|uniref:hypothetical protein n=1 Tax=uncultured Roseibium sp. TaxID=1936171 RepID=UPI0026369735|nr:hypothetical protein [uncultured Roseibium sp.]